MPAAVSHTSIASFTQAGTGTVRICLPLPIRSTMAQRSSRRCKLSSVSSASSRRRRPHPSRMARIVRLRFPVRVCLSGTCQSAAARSLGALRICGFDPCSEYVTRDRETGDVLPSLNGALTADSSESGADSTTWQIQRKDAGIYALANWAPQRTIGNDEADGRASLVDVASDPQKAHTLWRIQPAGNGRFWIVNSSTDFALSEVAAELSPIHSHTITVHGPGCSKMGDREEGQSGQMATHELCDFSTHRKHLLGRWSSPAGRARAKNC